MTGPRAEQGTGQGGEAGGPATDPQDSGDASPVLVGCSGDGGRLAAVLDSVGEAIVSFDCDLRVTHLNLAAATMTGCSVDDACSRAVGEVLQVRSDDPLADVSERCRQVVVTGQPVFVGGTDSLVGLGGLVVPVDYRVTPLRTGGGALVGGVVVLRDVTEERRQLAELEDRALRDPLTGLWNREYLRVLPGRPGMQGARSVLFIDLDSFKRVNDTRGHLAGDAVLAQVATVLTALSGVDADVVRMGGDEFLVLLHGADAGRAEALADGLVAALTRYDFCWDAARFRLGASIGVATDLTGERDVDALTAEADAACYRAKRSGGGMVALARR